MDRNLAMEFVRVTEAAALASARWVGLGDEKAADQAAVDYMRRAFDVVSMDGTVVIGEGERDEAPMLYIGEKVGSGAPPELDIALDPLEGTTLTAHGGPNALSVIAAAPKGSFLHSPDTYMQKIAVGPQAVGCIDIDAPPEENIKRVAKALGRQVEEITVMVLDRERHVELINVIRKAGARIRLITDGDVAAAVATAIPESGIDMMMGTGGAPEGVLAAAALKCMGGDMLGRLKFRNEQEKERAKKMGISDLEKIYRLDDLASGNDIFFAATGVTDGSMLKGVRFFKGGAYTHSMVMRGKSGTIRFIEAQHFFDRKPIYWGSENQAYK